MNTLEIKRQRGVDDLLCECAFTGNSQGDESWSNEIADYKAAKGWMSFRFNGVDINDQKAIYAEVERRKKHNADYIQQLKDEGRYLEEYVITFNFQPFPLFDK